MTRLTLLGIAGALRQGSTNRMLLREARAAFGPALQLEADLNLPLYDGDLESTEGYPAGVTRLYDQIAEADAVVISTPEYNKAPPGVLKNALDWVSRIKGNPWEDKPVAIISAAGGRGGGDRSQFALRLMLTPFQPRLLTGPELLVADSSNAFDEEGHLKDPRYRKVLDQLMAKLRAAAS
ncbi:NAD(P)H-dependent oxidoreductase [Pseudomonas sp. GX19020]|uniref:NADPH-dependent FMN reductase n=1 Tax=Pseudomonas sp. GX19020 TaxID=2942277 RepID=UPI0020186E5C|nr:NAD(P)H-dependent oxidoreductase [Pseudomonas sp. GX19020]MCL4066456.1 NAD(P)H-dependent oxidoreductase [Pseudomonas sp. GX19020]